MYPDYFADPFVWKDGDIYYAVGTGAHESSGQTIGKIFPLLQSADLVTWHYIGGAMEKPDSALGDTFWAPAVACAGGMFYLYYSVGHADRAHQLRVACANSPRGPYQDTGRALLEPNAIPFAIDPHPFQDVDGHWYLFFARDDLDCEGGVRAGTALAVHRLKSMTELDDAGRVVLRARSDWQRFQADRLMYGATWDWHTLEGPCVITHQGRYYCFYSGGCWQDETYGVDYGIADSALGPYSDAGNEAGPRVLRTIGDRLIGPGHNSCILGPDGSQHLVYHAWDALRKTRQMYISPILWTPNGPRCVSP